MGRQRKPRTELDMDKKRKAMIVVTEGVSRPLLEKWCAQGLLPGFGALLKEGNSGGLRSDLVPYEPPGLVTAFTGQSAGEHGWFSYWNVHNSDYRPRPMTSEELRHPFVWKRPEFRSKRFAIINVFGTHPPTPLNGWLITYPMQQTLNACYPRDLLWSLSGRGQHYTHDVSVWFSGQSQKEFLPLVLEADRRRGELALKLLDEGADAIIVNLTGIDRTSHCYWQELEEGSPVPATESAVFKAYQQCDQLIARLVERVTEHTSLLTFSEIGFGTLRAYCSVNNHLEEAGFLRKQTSGTEQTIWWEQTTAFEAVQGTHGVNINLAGRYAQGIVKAEDYQQLREQVMAALRECINPYTGLGLFRQVLQREEVYAGQSVAHAPDIILDPADERYLPLGDPFWATHVYRTRQSGWHRRDSYWAGMGGQFGTAQQGPVASLLDIGPTICRMLDIDVPPDFSGSSLTWR
jgi:predicted AlkP superfamily phosphohydrolase/phosphomutase